MEKKEEKNHFFFTISSSFRCVIHSQRTLRFAPSQLLHEVYEVDDIFATKRFCFLQSRTVGVREEFSKSDDEKPHRVAYPCLFLRSFGLLWTSRFGDTLFKIRISFVARRVVGAYNQTRGRRELIGVKNPLSLLPPFVNCEKPHQTIRYHSSARKTLDRLR